ncbi:transferase [Euhalothece natronophila Z-M001]|uniref:Transferase n=1 Tax=Euhalothece natronophila Z-M001 TaxID=522448 RepID=A0A5B8NN99_9CHRO|nr:transferase [Euhalothece natronophila]QDZ39715.1 transferase [Euhalothece natronophila Z-M001]
MSVLSLPITGHTEVYVSGEVTIDETATIAPGVILQATAQGRIIIRAGACLGMGTILTATEGTIEIGEGVILGAGVLIVGSGKISDRACIGAASTLISTSIEEMQLVSPGSLLGAPTRAENQTSTSQNGQSPPFNPDNNGGVTNSESNNSPEELSPASNSHPQPQDDSDDPWDENENPSEDEENSPSQEQSRNQATIYGQTHIERLMVTLFPHKDQFNKPNNNS